MPCTVRTTLHCLTISHQLLPVLIGWAKLGQQKVRFIYMAELGSALNVVFQYIATMQKVNVLRRTGWTELADAPVQKRSKRISWTWRPDKASRYTRRTTQLGRLMSHHSRWTLRKKLILRPRRKFRKGILYTSKVGFLFWMTKLTFTCRTDDMLAILFPVGTNTYF